MSKFEQLLKRTDLTHEELAHVINDVMQCVLREKEITIVRMILGIGCHPKTAEEIEDIIGFEEGEVMKIFNKAIAKLDDSYSIMAELKIRDLNFDEAKKISRKDGDLLVSDWYHKVSQMERINKPYQDLIDRLKQDAPELLGISRDDPLAPWKDVLESTPVGKLVYFATDGLNIQVFKKNELNLRIKTLWDLHQWQKPNGPITRYIQHAMGFKKILEEQCAELLERIAAIEKDYYLPTQYNEDISLYDNIKQAIAELVEFKIDSKPVKLGNETLTQVLYSHFVEKLPWADVAKTLGNDDSYLKNLERDFLLDLLHGNKINGNISLHKKIINNFLYFKENCAFESVSKMLPIIGNTEPELLSLAKCDIIELKDGIRFFIPKDSKGIYSSIWNQILDTLKESAIIPAQRDDIIDIVEDKLSTKDVSYDINFIHNILKCDEIVDILPNDMIELADSFLDDTKRIVRLLYQNVPSQYDKKHLEAIFENNYHRAPSCTYSRLSELGVSCTGNKWYYGTPMEPIINKIEQFALEHKHFYYADLESYLISEKYTIPKSIRNKITDICQVDTQDKMHFCHKDFVDNYPSFTWRRNINTGIVNWILNQANNYLKGKKSVLLSEVIDNTEKQAKDTEYEYRIRERSSFYLRQYSGDDQPFLIKDKSLKRNSPCYDNTDFETIGRRGNYPFYKQIRSLIAYEIKKTQDGRMLLTEAISLAVASLGDDIVKRGMVERALENQYLQPIDIELISENGKRYVVRTASTVKPEPTYQVVASQINQDVEVVQQVVDPQPRRSIQYREEVDWGKLSASLKSELNFYDVWMGREGYNIDKGVDKFLAFIKDSSNKNLSRVLPQNLYEYWFAGTDAFDRENYVRNLSIFYEALLSDMYYRKYNKKLSKKGLYEWADEFDMAHKISFYNDSKGFDRILTNLYRMRNKLAHGDAVELSSRDTANTIADYVALYVYTCQKYY